MHLVTALLGNADDPPLHRALHRLEHAGKLEWLVLPRSDLARRRLRAATDKGREVAIALPRDSALYDKAVLVLRDDLGVVLRVETERWLGLQPRDPAAALALGYHAGNLHWRVRFEGARLMVALEGPVEGYIERVLGFIEDGRVRVVEPDKSTNGARP
jgi:urease accessory protein